MRKFWAVAVILLAGIFALELYAAEEKKEFYDNGNPKSVIVLVNGQVESEQRFRNDGKMEYEMKQEKGKKVEVFYEYYPEGLLMRERRLENGIQEGLEKEYYLNGKVKAERNYLGGKRHGNAKGYYENGNVQGDWQFENGVPVAAKIFYPSGVLHMVHAFKDGKINGETKEYGKDGKVMALRYYEDDKMIRREHK